MRCLLVAAAALATAPLVAGPARAADPVADGNWLLSTVGPAGETPVCVVKVETAGGKQAASVAAAVPKIEVTVRDYKAGRKEVTFTVRQVRALGNREITTEQTFVGTPGGDPAAVLGSLAGERGMAQRAKLAPTDKTELAAAGPQNGGPAAALWRKSIEAQQGQSNELIRQYQQEKDEAKKKELVKKIMDSQKEGAVKAAGICREVIEKHPDAPAAVEAALRLALSAQAAKVTAAEAAKLVEVAGKGAVPYGPRYARDTLGRIADLLVNVPGLEAASLAAIAPVAEDLTESVPAADQAKVLTTYKAALEKAGKADAAKPVATRLAALENRLDDEYLKSVPPFKPGRYAGRKEPGANKVAVLELFTGAQCPPCVAADVAFDALQKSYGPADLVLLQYHMHIPGPDPLTNPETVARWDFYDKTFPGSVQGTPSSIFNGKRDGGTGGFMEHSKEKFETYRKVVDAILEKTTDVKVGGSARLDGGAVKVAVEVAGLKDPADKVRLRLALVEETVKYTGGNGLRFHHQVVRSLFGKPDGVPVKGLTGGKHAASLDLTEVRTGLTKYLDGYAAERPFPNPNRPLDLAGLKVVALVQDDETGEILQAAQMDVSGQPTANARH